MAGSGEHNRIAGRDSGDGVQSWIIVVLTLIFVGLYVASFTGLLEPLADDNMLVRLEPIIFAIIGYYFGRLPGQQNERTLRDEVNQKTQQTAEAQRDKEEALTERVALSEKIANAKTALASAAPGDTSTSQLAANLSGRSGTIDDLALRQSAAACLRILES